MLSIASKLGIDPAAGHPERALALGYAKSEARAGIAALFALDATLGRLARGTRDEATAQLRLAWWRDALARTTGPAVRQPILEALAQDGQPLGVALSTLVPLVDGWEALVVGDITAHGRDRGRTLFAAAGIVVGASDAVIGAAGEGWALADLATNSPDPAIVRQATAAAAPWLDEACAHRWSRAARPLGALAHVARMDLGPRAIGSPSRIARLIRHRLTGG